MSVHNATTILWSKCFSPPIYTSLTKYKFPHFYQAELIYESHGNTKLRKFVTEIATKKQCKSKCARWVEIEKKRILDLHFANKGVWLWKGFKEPIKKTKILSFHKNGHMPSTSFHFGDLLVEKTKSYKYLGTIVTNTGNFKLKEVNLKKKGLRASYLISKITHHA